MAYKCMVKSLIISVCFLPFVAFGQFTLTDAQFIDPIPCSYEAPYARNLLLEGFDIKLAGFENEGQGYGGGSSNRWTLYGATSKITPAYDIRHLTTNKPAGSCDQAIRFVFGTDGVEAAASYDFGFAIDLDTTTNFLFFNFMVESIPPSADWVYIFGYDLSSPSVPNTAAIRIQRASATTYSFQWVSGDFSGTSTMTVGTWYSVVTDLRKTTANDCQYRVWQGDGARVYPSITGSVGAGSFTRNAGDLRYIQLGATADLSGPNDNFTILFDSLSVYRLP